MLPAELVHELRRLEIRSRRVTDELLSGSYRSLFRGRGMEFDSLRPYQEGDDVRSIDWTVAARTGEIFVKEFVEERELNVLLMADVSASSLVGTGGGSLRERLTALAALLGFCAAKSGDKVGLLTFTGQVEKFVPLRTGRRHLLRLLSELLAPQVAAASGTDPRPALIAAGKLLRKRSIVFFLTDGMLECNFLKELRQLNYRHEVIFLHLCRPAEEADFSLPMLVEDSESGECFNTLSPGKILVRREADLNNELAELCRQSRCDYLQLNPDKDFLPPLQKFFKRRGRR